MRKELLTVLAAFVLWCCNSPETVNAPQKETPKDEKKEDKSGQPQADDFSGCYMQVIQRDTFVASLQQKGQIVTGKLSFNNFEKDKSSGAVNGRVENNTVKLLYIFQSEGMTSMMEVYFRKKGDALIRGIGDMQTRGDTAYFSNPAAISYPQDEKMILVDCEKLPSKYRK